METLAIATVPEERQAFARAARYFLQLSPRQLPSRFLYNTLGSALFDAICHLPWYCVTRGELRLLKEHAGTIGRLFRTGGRVVELGCGSGEKLATLLTNAKAGIVQAHLIDLSESAIARAVQTLAAVGSDVHVTTHQATYEDGLLGLPAVKAPTLVALLGSNIGNFDAPAAAAFLGLIRASLQTRDYLLLGADLVKPEHELLLAYDDPLGLTAAFNKNLLLRMNTELDANFMLERFRHRAIWNREASRVEMHVVSRGAQKVDVAGAGLRFCLEDGEIIWTESSYKFTPQRIRQLVEPAGFVQRYRWIDERARFALTLFEAA
jgi:L-histidine Nalpha-methyltransferase